MTITLLNDPISTKHDGGEDAPTKAPASTERQVDVSSLDVVSFFSSKWEQFKSGTPNGGAPSLFKILTVMKKTKKTILTDFCGSTPTLLHMSGSVLHAIAIIIY